MITSIVEGRIRIRDSRLKSPLLLDAIKSYLFKFEGFKEIGVNQKTGSILLIYDSSKTDSEKLISHLKEILDLKTIDIKNTKAEKIPIPKVSRKFINWALLLSLAFSMGGLLFGNRTFHLIFGFFFLLFVGIHVFIYRKILFT